MGQEWNQRFWKYEINRVATKDWATTTIEPSAGYYASLLAAKKAMALNRFSNSIPVVEYGIFREQLNTY